MIYRHVFKGLEVRTGDLLATTDGSRFLAGQFWRLVGRLVPGAVDHIVVYVGPGPRCVEAGAKMRVIQFQALDDWDGEAMRGQRGLVDTLYGAAYPLAGQGASPEREQEIRRGVA
ncbi:MAG: hypothetical protein PHV85_08990, partial [Desulfovibrionaceae bacterium]|nr:hypothetical protein [Desulfovibrionaceae bacterium]